MKAIRRGRGRARWRLRSRKRRASVSTTQPGSASHLSSRRIVEMRMTPFPSILSASEGLTSSNSAGDHAPGYRCRERIAGDIVDGVILPDTRVLRGDGVCGRRVADEVAEPARELAAFAFGAGSLPAARLRPSEHGPGGEMALGVLHTAGFPTPAPHSP